VIETGELPTARFRRAVETRDVDGLMETLSPDVVLHSPITDRVSFKGHDEVRELLACIFATVDDIHYFADVGDERTRAMFSRANVGGQPLEEAIRVEINEDRLITEMTLSFRPLPGLAALTAALAPLVARKHGAIRPVIARVLLAPLALATRIGDRLVTRFV
jgi:hypothetical protein